MQNSDPGGDAVCNYYDSGEMQENGLSIIAYIPLRETSSIRSAVEINEFVVNVA